MANLMLDFTKGFVSSVAPESLSDLKSDAENIRDTLMGGAKTAQDKYREIRNSSGFKKVTDWFFHRGSEFGEKSSFENDNDDEFDAGFNFDDGDSDTSSSKVLDYDGMKDIAKGQVSSMYQIAGKQTEASAMTASEIITTMNTRSSEILSSLGNINSSLQTISGKLDKLIELSTVATQERARQQSLFDSSGNLTLGNTINYLKQNLPYQTELSLLKTGAEMLPMIFQASSNKAEGFGSLAGLMTGLAADKKLRILDNRSIDEIRDAIDERVNNAQNNLLSKLLDWDKFKKLFGDLSAREKNRDYSTYIDNQYNREKAVFDNMTRKTIIDVIPGYLRRITAALTGENLYVSSEGSLSTERPREFQNVFSSTIQSGFNSRRIDEMMKQASSDIDKNDVFIAQRVLVSLYIFHEMRVSGRATQGKMFENGGLPEVNDQAIDYLTQGDNNKHGRAYWTSVIQLIITKLMTDSNSRDAFARTIRQGATSSHSRAKRYAETATVTYDIGEITDEMVSNIVGGYVKNASGKDDRTWNERAEAGEIKRSDIPKWVDPNSRASDEALKQARRERIKQSELIGNIGVTFRDVTASTVDYLASIFTILNRGVNVYAVRRRNKPYVPIELQKAQQNTPASPQSTLTHEQPTPIPSVQIPTISGEETDGDHQQPDMPSSGNPLSDTINSAKNFVMKPINKMKERLSTDMTSLKAMTIDSASIDYNRVMAQRTAAGLGDSEDDKNDKYIADSVLAAMNASVQDGDTKEDTGPLMQQISEIKNPKLKARLSKVVEGTLQRAENKKPAQSKLGKILTWGFGIVKGFILPKLQSAKTFITTLGKKLLSPIINSLRQSGQRILGGANAIKEGFFGSDESSGIFGRMRENKESRRLNGMLSDINETPTSTKQTLTTDVSASSLIDLGAPVLSDMGEGKDIKSGRDTEVLQEIKKIRGDINEQKEENKKGNAITRAMNNFVEKFKQTDFGKGFISAFEKKKSNKEMKPQTLSDQMTKSIVDILKSKDGTGSIFGTIVNKLAGIGDVVKEGIAKISGKSETISGTGSSMPSIGDDTSSQSTVSLADINENVSSQRQNVQMPATTDMTGGATGSAASAAAGAVKKGIGFDIGKILGGITGILGGLLQAVLTVVLSMKAVKSIMNLAMNVLKTALKPLNKAFQSLYKAIKPVMKTIQRVLTQLVGYVVEIVESVIKIIQPIIEAIGPLLEQMLTILKPILDMITDTINILVVPLTAIMQTVVVPILQGVGNSLQIITGILQVGLGTIITVLGWTLTGIGVLTSILGGTSLYEKGKAIAESGENLFKSGVDNVSSGLKSSIALATNTMNNLLGTNDSNEEPEEETKVQKRQEIIGTLNGSPMDGVYGNGDIRNIYGGAGANQNRYGNFMNMNSRGCGPIALADAYARRSGTSVNARGLTSAMASSGAYNPNMGTSVAGFMNTAGSMGMNLRAGGVTPASLKQASPRNPITVIGSGTDFTTRSGNNHFMNVIGSSGGTAFVSNPMNGRIERRSISSLAANSVAGLYGSGDVPRGAFNVYGSGDATYPYSFSDEVQEALQTLKDLVGGIIGIFTGEESTEAKLKNEQDKLKYDKVLTDLGDMTDEEKQKLEKEAFELFKQENPKYKGETNAEYEKRFKKTTTYNHYITVAGTKRLEDAAKKAAGYTDETLPGFIKKNLGEFDSETGERKGGLFDSLTEGMKKHNDSVSQGMFFSKLQDMIGDYWDDDEDAGFYSDNGARLYTDEYQPSVFENDATGWTSTAVPNTVMGEWMDKMLLGTMMSSPFRWRGRPVDKDAEGTNDGRAHSGVDFTLGGDIPILSTTDGVVIGTAKTSYGDGYGTYVKIQDEGGDIHLYAHMREDPGPLVKVGDYVYGGDQLGIMGSTGESTGQHLHYEIRDGDTGEILNPHAFFKWHEGSRSNAPYGEIEYEGDLEAGDIWSFHKNKTGVSKFMQTAFDAGLTGPEVAAITSMGIWEDGGDKLWGDKSLLNVTYDSNSQQAVGLMNWVDTSVDYGDTVEKQLQYIQRTYFDEDTKDGRALVSHNQYDDADLRAYMAATGRDGWALDFGDRYGPYMNKEDLIEGSEHWYRTALVPAVIHQMEGPRKYIGTAVGVYNWLLDEGYIDEGGRRSNIRYNTSSTISTSPTSLTESEGFGATVPAAATSAQSSYTTLSDKTDGTPYRYSTTITGRTGTAYNKANQKLFDYYVPTGNATADAQAFTNKHKYVERQANLGSGKFMKIYVDTDSYYKTHAGENARSFINGEQQLKNSSSSTAQQSSVITTGTSDVDLRKIWQAIYTNYSNSYANKLSRGDMANDFNNNAYHNGYKLYYDTSDGNVYFKNNKSAGRIRVNKDGSIYWPDVSSAQVNNGINVINNSSTTGTTTYTETNDHSRRQSYVDMLNNKGNGDVSSVFIPSTNYGGGFDQGLSSLFSMDQIEQQAYPTVVNNYAVDHTGDAVIDMLMSNTYNIRSEEIESLLAGMLKLMKERKKRGQTASTTGRTSKQSNEAAFPDQGIPRQVERLSVG